MGFEPDRRRWRVQGGRKGKEKGVSEARTTSARDDYFLDRAMKNPIPAKNSRTMFSNFSFVSKGHNVIWRSPHHFEHSENIIVRKRIQNDIAASRK